MPAYQYIYVMKGLGKTYPGGREVLKDIWLSFLPGAKIGVLGPQRRRQVDAAAHHGRRSTRISPARPGRPRARTVGYLPQEPALDPDKDVVGNVIEGLAETKALLDRFEAVSARFAEDLADDEMNDADRRAGRAAGEDRPGRRLGARPHGRDRDGRAALPAGRCRRSRTSRAASGGASRCAGCCCRSPTCCCSTSRPTISTPNRSPGCSASSKDYPGTVVTVTHDRYFLDEVAGWILELDRGRGIPYEGNYSGWLEQKQKRLEQEGKPGGGAPAHARARARMGAAEPARPPGQEQGAPLGLRDAGRRRAARRRPRRRRSCCRRGRGSATSSSRPSVCARPSATSC